MANWTLDGAAWIPTITRWLKTTRVLGTEATQPEDTADVPEFSRPILEIGNRTEYLKAQIDAINALLGNLDTDTLEDLDLVTLALENKRQSVTVASGDTTKTINLANGAIISLSLNNTSACSFIFSNMRQCLSGELILTAVGADRTFILPATWQPTEISRTIVVRSGTKRIMAFEYEQMAVGGGSPLPEIVIASSISEALLTT